MKNVLHKYKAILFDVGDTLLIRNPSERETLKKRLYLAGYNVDDEQVKRAQKKCELWIGQQILKEINGAPRLSDADFRYCIDRVAVTTIFKEETAYIEKIVSDISYIEAGKQEWILVDGVKDVLAKLKSRGFTLAVVSNFNSSLPELLKKFKVNNYFNDIIVSSLVRMEKPDPKILHLACDRIGVPPNNSIYIGDHPFDVLCAKRAGMDVVWVCDEDDELPSYLDVKPDYCIRSIKQMSEGL